MSFLLHSQTIFSVIFSVTVSFLRLVGNDWGLLLCRFRVFDRRRQIELLRNCLIMNERHCSKPMLQTVRYYIFLSFFLKFHV